MNFLLYTTVLILLGAGVAGAVRLQRHRKAVVVTRVDVRDGDAIGTERAVRITRLLSG